MVRSILILISVISSARIAAAEAVRLSSDALNETMRGSLIELDTPLGTTVPVRFSPDGLMSGEAKELAPILGSEKDRGRWWVSNDQLCYKWFRWFDAEPRCLVIHKDGARIFWTRDDGETGTGTLVEQGTRVTGPAPPVANVAASEKGLPTASISKAAEASATGVGKFVVAGTAAAPSGSPADEGSREVKRRDTASDNFNPARRRSAKVAAAAPPKKAVAGKQKAPLREPEKLVSKPERAAVRSANSAMPAPPLRAAASLATPARAENATFRVANVHEFDVLNIRSGPSQDHDPIGMIPPTGRGIVITGRCRNEWCPIKHRNTSGWVNRYYLTQEVQR